MIYKFSVIHIKIPKLFSQNGNANSQIHMHLQESYIFKTILKNKNEAAVLRLSSCNIIESPEISTNMLLTDLQ